ncbi:MAG TPA: MarR family transcriptional regulator [Actinospica sp.]|jgi:DNA-binding MarR family transcriptional regulator|nr:MarR family transcriptional regulator [Actinospica sp.]
MEAGRTAETAAVAGELRVVLVRLVRRLREQSEGSDLTRSQSTVLGRLERDGPTTATALARAEGIRPQSMGAIVAALDAAGLIAGSPDPGDGRKTILELTEKAREEFRTGRLAKEDWLTQAIAAKLDAAEIRQLGEAIELLTRIAEA